MRFVVTDNKRAGDWGAVYIAKKIKEFNPSPEKKFILGLPTGSTPLQICLLYTSDAADEL